MKIYVAVSGQFLTGRPRVSSGPREKRFRPPSPAPPFVGTDSSTPTPFKPPVPMR